MVSQKQQVVVPEVGRSTSGYREGVETETIFVIDDSRGLGRNRYRQLEIKEAIHRPVSAGVIIGE